MDLICPHCQKPVTTLKAWFNPTPLPPDSADETGVFLCATCLQLSILFNHRTQLRLLTAAEEEELRDQLRILQGMRVMRMRPWEQTPVH